MSLCLVGGPLVSGGLGGDPITKERERCVAAQVILNQCYKDENTGDW